MGGALHGEQGIYLVNSFVTLALTRETPSASCPIMVGRRLKQDERSVKSSTSLSTFSLAWSLTRIAIYCVHTRVKSTVLARRVRLAKRRAEDVNQHETTSYSTSKFPLESNGGHTVLEAELPSPIAVPHPSSRPSPST